MATRLPDQVEHIVRNTERTLGELDKRAYAEAVRYTEEARGRAASGAERRMAELTALATTIASEAGRIEAQLQRLAVALDDAGRRLRAATTGDATGNGSGAAVLESAHSHPPR
jgi:hypothetical protein